MKKQGQPKADAASGLVVERVATADLHLDPANVRRHPERNLASIRASLARFGQQRPILVDADNVVRAGNGTLEAARSLGWESIDCVRTPLKGSEATAYAIADNRTAEHAEWHSEALADTLRALQAEDFDLGAVGFTADEVDELCGRLGEEALAGDPGGGTGDAADAPRPSLAERFGVPPFSVLDARQGYWQDRKRAWLALGIQSELGRGGGC